MSPSDTSGPNGSGSDPQTTTPSSDGGEDTEISTEEDDGNSYGLLFLMFFSRSRQRCYKVAIVLGFYKLALVVVGGLLAVLILGVIAFVIIRRVKGLSLRKHKVRTCPVQFNIVNSKKCLS